MRCAATAVTLLANNAEEVGATLLSSWAVEASKQHNRVMGRIHRMEAAVVYPIEEIKEAREDLWPAEDDVNLLDTLDIKPQQVLAMRDAHKGFVRAINNRMPEYIPLKRAPKQGIVTVGGGKYFPPLMVSLRLLRRTGTRLPIEVFLPEEEYEPELCEHVMPELNAFCRTFPNFDGKITHFQFKIFAILLSSFSDVLWLDADNFPLHDTAPLFKSDPFQENGLITWPDLWQTSVSPAYYLIASRTSTPVSARASTESGQLLISKVKHWKTLLLAAYYNYYGPGYYYPILCQGGTGCGDKETFLPAAEAMGLPFYDIKAQPYDIGHYKINEVPDEGVYRFGLIQGDLLGDYEIKLALDQAARKAGMEEGGHLENTTSSDLDDLAAYDDVPPLFFHMSTPKWDAPQVFDHVGEYDFTWDTVGQPAAAFRDPPETADMIKGVERMVWEEPTERPSKPGIDHAIPGTSETGPEMFCRFVVVQAFKLESHVSHGISGKWIEAGGARYPNGGDLLASKHLSELGSIGQL
ncbi:hypothetical protein VMCG_05949 [Cytospora schulzeri]|uniref:Uncharacterized protein n=1 Tax=Cytospora schulzeri TaxID=448051 RepID=A0A423WDN4_9PEZI|nr:hypothetical protein VMCG_05949 [Valsa malicola]